MMEAPKRPHTEDKLFCATCGHTCFHFREEESKPWRCSICGSDKVKSPKEKEKEKF